MPGTRTQPSPLRPVDSGSRQPVAVAVRVSDRPLQVALESVVGRHGFTICDDPQAADCELVASPAAASELVPSILLVEPSPVWSQVGMGAIGAGLVDAVVARQCIDDVPFVMEALVDRDLSTVSLAVRRAAQLIPPLSRRQHMLLALISGRHVKSESIARALACSPATVKREVRKVRQALGLGSRLELLHYARPLGYTPHMTAMDISLLVTD
jgi:DNA-binding CsgD family transcriptional regulator